MTAWTRHSIYANYEFSDGGDVRHIKNKAVRSLRSDKDGYLRLNLWHEGYLLTVCVHREVAHCFIQRPKHQVVVNHKDGNKKNNSVSNLEWLTDHENKMHAHHSGLYSKDCPVIIAGVRYYSKREAERRTGVKRQQRKRKKT